jgi:hypothetical protein
MKRMHALGVAMLLALAAIFGVVAATRTARIGAAAPAPNPSAAISARQKRLDGIEASLQRALADRPPALPAAATPPPTAALAPRVVYRRPAPVVVVAHRSDGEPGEYEAEGEGAEGDRD